MGFSLPNPSTPTNGQSGDATPILQNELAIAQAIAAFDGSQINAGSVTDNALAASINPRVRGAETLANFVYSGCTWSALSGANGTMTGGTIYVNGYRTIVSGVGSNTFTLSNDTYVDIDYLGNLTYNSVANGATAPALTANAIRVAKVVTSGSAISTITQTGVDSNNVPILSHQPGALNFTNTIQAYIPSLSGQSGGAWNTPTGYYINLGGIKLSWGTIAFACNGSGVPNTTGRCSVSLPPGNFFTTCQIGIPAITSQGNNAFQVVSGDSFVGTPPTTFGFYVSNTGNTGSAVVSWFIIGT